MRIEKIMTLYNFFISITTIFYKNSARKNFPEISRGPARRDPRAWFWVGKTGRFGITNKCIIRCAFYAAFFFRVFWRVNKASKKCVQRFLHENLEFVFFAFFCIFCKILQNLTNFLNFFSARGKKCNFFCTLLFMRKTHYKCNELSLYVIIYNINVNKICFNIKLIKKT